MINRIVITGPESSGKTTLAEMLSKEYSLPLVKEYAREYIEKLDSAYEFEDVKQMAKAQLKLEHEARNNLSVCDTDLTVYYVWIKEKYQKELDWINQNIEEGNDKIYFLCDVNDVDWEFDPMREHPNLEDRKRLFEAYVSLLEKYNLNYYIISGDIPTRLKKCKEILDSIL